MSGSGVRPRSVDPALVGRRYVLEELYEVSRAKIAELAAATGATHPAHTDPAAARELGYDDVVAPPTFAAIVAQRAEQAYVTDPASGIDFSRVLHAEEHLVHHRPIVAGDRLRATVHVASVAERAGITMVTTRTELADDGGAPVATVTSTLAVRGEGR